jgi:quinol monooxygenase YgiN
MIVVTAKITGKPERKADLLRLIATAAPHFRAEAGCVSYNFYERQPAASEFLMFEEWADQAAANAHMKSSHFQEFAKQMKELLQEPTKLRIYEIAKTHDL